MSRVLHELRDQGIIEFLDNYSTIRMSTRGKDI